jgi:hypothetical protein
VKPSATDGLQEPPVAERQADLVRHPLRWLLLLLPFRKKCVEGRDGRLRLDVFDEGDCGRADSIHAAISAHDLLVAALGDADDGGGSTARHREVMVLATEEVPSPPPAWNFSLNPTIHGRDEFWLRKHGDSSVRRPTAARPGADFLHVPPPSYWPLLLAASVLGMVSDLLVGMEQALIGGVLTPYCIYRFAMEHHREAQTEYSEP